MEREFVRSFCRINAISCKDVGFHIIEGYIHVSIFMELGIVKKETDASKNLFSTIQMMHLKIFPLIDQ